MTTKFRHVSARSLALTILLASGTSSLAIAQTPPAPATAPAPPAQGIPVQTITAPAPTVPPAPYVPPPPARITSTDEDVKAVTSLLAGSFRSQAMGDTPALVLHAAIVNVEGLDNALYFEVGRADAPWSSFRNGLFHVYSAQTTAGKQLVLRVLDFAKFVPTHQAMMTGIWAAPEMFPAVTLDRLFVNTDIPLTRDSAGWRGLTASTPTLVGGAVRFSTEFALSQGSISWADRGTNADNTQVWGPSLAQSLTFVTYQPEVTVDRRANGLVVIDFATPASDALTEAGTELAVHVNGFLQSDGLQVDNSKAPGREPLRVTLPAQLPFVGISEGLSGVRIGQFRRLIVPSVLGFGERGRARSNIPANATLVYEIEGLYAKPPEPQPAADTKPATGAPSAELQK